MKIFQSTLEFLAFIGITAESRPFNVRNLLVLLTFGTMVTLICTFLLREASTFKDYTDSIYMSSVTIAITTTFLSLIWKKENVFQFIDFWEEIAKTSK